MPEPPISANGDDEQNPAADDITAETDATEEPEESEGAAGESTSSNTRYRTQRRPSTSERIDR